MNAGGRLWCCGDPLVLLRPPSLPEGGVPA